MNLRSQILEALSVATAALVLPRLKSVQTLTARLIAKVEARLPRGPVVPVSPNGAPVPANARWTYFWRPMHLSLEEMRRIVSAEDLATARGFRVAAIAPHAAHAPVALWDYEAYRSALRLIGEWHVPEQEPDREALPATLVDCHFDFEMPEEFAKNPAGDPERRPLDIDFTAHDVADHSIVA